MATFTRVKSGSWRAQVWRKGRYAAETFLRRDDARRWATETERQVDRGETPAPSRIARINTIGDWIGPHVADMKEVGKAPGRSKAATLAMLKRELGSRNIEFGPAAEPVTLRRLADDRPSPPAAGWPRHRRPPRPADSLLADRQD